jgi:hypothetical protein
MTPRIDCNKTRAMQKSGVNGPVNLCHNNLTQQENFEDRESIGGDAAMAALRPWGYCERGLSE